MRINAFASPLMAIMLLLSAVSTISLVAQAQSKSSRAPGWVNYSPAGNEFAVSFPSAPEEQSEMVTMLGRKYQVKLYGAADQKDGGIFIVATIVLPTLVTASRNDRLDDELAASWIKAITQGIANALRLDSNQITIENHGAVSQKGLSGRQYKISLAETPSVARMFLFKSTLYFQWIVGRDEQSAETTKFFNSFKVSAAEQGKPSSGVLGGVPGGVPYDGKSEKSDLIPPPPPPPPSASSTSNAPLPKVVTVSGSLLSDYAIRKVQPPYPPIAKAARASGGVQIQVLISESGEVIEAAVISGHPLLRDAALQAAKQWLFKPAELSGTPVKVLGVLTFNFILDENKQ